MTIRPETSRDVAAIDRVTKAAFATARHASGTEHLIVRGLRDAGQLSISLVAEERGVVIGHVAVSPVLGVAFPRGAPGPSGVVTYHDAFNATG